MSIVLDTNVLLSAKFTTGLCSEVLARCLKSAPRTVSVSEYILGEFAQHASKKFGAPPALIERFVALLRAECTIVEPLPFNDPRITDLDDLPVIGTAIAARATALVTGDRALLELQSAAGIPIITPRALLMALR